MDWFTAPGYWLGRLVFQRALAGVYLFAFVGAALQFRALIGERGMLPVPRYVRRVPFRRAPSLFGLRYSDRLFAGCAWTGAALAGALAAGAGDAVPPGVAMGLWAVVWALYLSIVNVGQTWYAFGWESLLLEAGFLAVFLGNARTGLPVLVLWLLRWLLFRVEFGAGLIKMRGDPCWRKLTCLYFHHETQPVPGPLSWFFHHLPKPLHRVECAAGHFTQLCVPVLLFAPQPVASYAAGAIAATQLWLVLSGNFAWLNWLTVALALSPGYARDWFGPFVERLLAGDRDTLRLLGDNPFPEAPPVYVRARVYRYRFTTWRELRATGDWWHRTPVRAYLAPTRLAGTAPGGPARSEPE
ncbi:lipase maturation factor family protein [Streptomyces subrutilus]|uniref:lipase maturation factor family protein n=1 Tax=Streptomyces subrutilus TaxID=36818 RepID=UPI0033EF94F6